MDSETFIILAQECCEILSELYLLRKGEKDHYASAHWRKIKDFLGELPYPLSNPEDIQDLQQHKGIGPKTIEVLEEIWYTSYLGCIDGLIYEVPPTRLTPDLHIRIENLRRGRRQQAYGAFANRRTKSRGKGGANKFGLEFTRAAMERGEDKIKAALNTDMCCICYEENTAEDRLLVLNNCDHSFHSVCIQNWLKSMIQNRIQPTCPLCRTRVQA